MVVPESSLDNVEFVHMRQYLRIQQRRIDKERIKSFDFKIGSSVKKKVKRHWTFPSDVIDFVCLFGATKL